MISKKIISVGVILTGISAAILIGLNIPSPDIENSIENDDFKVDTSLHPQRMFELGEYYFNHTDAPDGEYDLRKARAYYEAAIEIDPRAHPAVWYQLGRIDFIEGKFNAALYKFDKQLQYFEESGLNPYYMIGLTYGYKARQSGLREDWDAGAEAFEKFIDFEPYAPWPRVDLAWIYFAQGKYEEMKPTLERGLEHYPDNAWLLNMYGLALLNTDNKLEARRQFVLAQSAVADITAEDWGKAYPGNNPADWAQGLQEFRDAIEKNITLTD